MAEKRSNAGWWILGITVVGIPLLYYLVIGGRVDGQEFSPDDFSRRHFTYNIMPIFKIRLRGIEYQDKTPVFEQTLLADGYLGKTGTKPGKAKQWHLIEDSHSEADSRDFDAQLLIRFLDQMGEEYESIWIKWNEDHPNLAKKFWPIVADMARSYLYVELTEIMSRATIVTEDSEDEFENYMIDAASEAFLNHAELRKENEDFEAALELYQKSNRLSASQRAAKGIQECRNRLGKNGMTKSSDISAEAEEE